MYPGLKDTIGGPEKVRERLTEVLPKVWDSIERLSSLRVCGGVRMPSRVCATIAAKTMVHQILGHNHNTPGPAILPKISLPCTLDDL
jgi:hypothetical protein